MECNMKKVCVITGLVVAVVAFHAVMVKKRLMCGWSFVEDVVDDDEETCC